MSAEALVTQGGPGSNLLLQDLKLKPGQRHRLSLWIQYRNQGGEFASPNTFDVGGGMPTRAEAPRAARRPSTTSSSASR